MTPTPEPRDETDIFIQAHNELAINTRVCYDEDGEAFFSDMQTQTMYESWSKRAAIAEAELAEVREQRNQQIVAQAFYTEEIENMTRERDELRAELERVKADAVRYQWLCSKFEITKLPCAIERILGGEVYVADGKASIDAAIDTSRDGEGGEK